jgi:hypothetical protein
MCTSPSMPVGREVDALPARASRLERERLKREMNEGYRFEAEAPSLDPEWAELEAVAL